MIHLTGRQRRTVTNVTASLKRNNFRFCIFGGAAASFYGSARHITDFDLYVDVYGKQILKQIVGTFQTEKNNTITIDNIELCAAPVRVGDREKEQFWSMDDEAERRCLTWGDIPVIAREDLIVIKAALRRGEERGKFDVYDLKQMAIVEARLDAEYMAFRIGSCNLSSDLLGFIRECGFKL